MNSLYQELRSSQSNQSEEQLKAMVEDFKSSPNKKQYLQNMIMQNPTLKNIQGITNLLNGKLDENMMRNMFIKSAKARGFDPQRMMTIFGLQ